MKGPGLMIRFRKSHREFAMAGVSALALTALAAPAAWAQSTQPASTDQSTTPSTGTVKEVVVTGQRAALKSAQDIKKNSDQIVDSITATDIGALPDRSVTEALQRVVGVTISRTDNPRDSQRVVVEGGDVQVRGLSYVESLLDGRDSFSAINGRALSWADIPPELFAGVDVYKNPSAELIEGGVGGTVDLRTRMPFDQSGRLIAFSLDETYADLVDNWRPGGSVLASDRWQTPIGEFGLLVDLSDSKYSTRSDTLSVDQYYVRSTSDGSCNAGGVSAPTIPGAPTNIPCVYVPGGFGYRSLVRNTERTGIDVAGQWRSPDNRLLVTGRFFNSAYRATESEHAVGVDPDSNTSFFPASGAAPFVYDKTGHFISGTFAQSANGTNVPASVLDERWDNSYAVTSDYSLNFKFKATDRLTLTADVQYINSQVHSLDFTVFDLPSELSTYGSNTLPASTINMSGQLPKLTIPVSSAYASNPAYYYWNAAMDYHQRNHADEWAERVDGSYTFDSDWLKSFRFGVRHTERDLITRQTNFNWGDISESWTGMGQALLNGTSVAPTWAGGGVIAGESNSIPSKLMPFQNFFGGQVAMPSTFLASTSSFISNWPGALKAIAQAENCPATATNPHPFCQWAPFNGNYASFLSNGGENGINVQNEDTWAEYGTLKISHDLPLPNWTVPFDVNIGVRVLQTKAAGTGTATYNPLTGGTFSAQDDAFANGTSHPYSGGRDYTNVLPSLNARFKLTPDLFLRLAYAKSIVRPAFNQMQPTFNVSGTAGYIYPAPTGCNLPVPPPATTGGPSMANCVYQYTGFAGDPALKPTRANSYDLALEWYFAKVGHITTGLFYKDVYNFITTGVNNVKLTNNGVTETVLLTEPYNAGHGTIKGFEVDYLEYFDFLPGPLKGLGVSANYTVVDSNGARNASADPYDPTQIANAQGSVSSLPLPLEGLSRNTYNAALLYDRGPFSGRIAYNWREKYLLTTSAANINLPVWAGDFGQLDASFFYTINKHLKAGVEAANITASTYKTIVSYPTTITQFNPGMTTNTWVDADRRVSLVLRGSF